MAAEAGGTVIILIPSYKRPGDAPTRIIFPDATLCVHEFEAEAYAEASGGNIAVIPDALRGNMARVRNWMLEYGYERDDEVLMVDDDIREFATFYQGERYPVTGTHLSALLADGFRMAREIGARLWGINCAADPRFYHAWKPFGLHNMVLGTFCGHIKNPIRYDERLSLNEDYDFFLQSLRKYRVVWRFDQYVYQASHLGKAGGCGAYRTLAEENDQADIFIKKWGSKIVRFKGRDTNPIIKSPI